MAEINSLLEIYKRKGKKFVDELFSKYTTINEKMDASIFIVERSPVGEFTYYKRDQRFPISKIDRVLLRYWEMPINYIQSLDPIIQNKIPVYWRFGFDYFIDNKPLDIEYEKTPKNNLILSYIQVRDSKGTIIRNIDSKVELDKWADLLGVERPPMIFQGYLNNEQKRKVLDFLNSYPERLKSEFGTNSFIKYLIKILLPESEGSKLNSNWDMPIEGIVFKFGSADGSEETILAKVIDPVFEEISLQKSLKRGESRNKAGNTSFEYSLNDITRFIIDSGIKSFVKEGATKEERYINYISDVFVKFLSDPNIKRIYYGSDLDAPEYLKKESFRINSELLSNPEVKKLVLEDFGYASLFKMILNSFRKFRKKEGGLIGKGELEQINMVVSQVSSYLSNNASSIQESSTLPSFSSFHMSRKDYLILEDDKEGYDEYAEEGGEEREEPLNWDIEVLPDPMEIDIDITDHTETVYEPVDNSLSVAPSEPGEVQTDLNIPTPEINPNNQDITQYSTDRFKEAFGKIIGSDKISDEVEEEKSKEHINLVIGRFYPFHMGHLDLIKKLNKSNGNKIFLALICNDDQLGTISKMLDLVIEENKEIIGYKKYKNRFLDNVIKDLSNNYIINAIGCSDEEIDDLKIQLNYIKKNDTNINIELLAFPRISSGGRAREYVKEENYKMFKDEVPGSVSLFYDDIRQNLNKL